MPKYYNVAYNDIESGVSGWRIWTMLASSDIKQRYRRSVIGQFWLTLSMAVMITGMGAVYSILFKQDIKSYLPHIAVGLVMWAFISTVIVESGTAFIENERIMLHTHVPPSLFIFRLLYRNMLILAHNVVIFPFVFVILGVSVNANILWFIPGFLLVLLNCFWIAFFVAIICVRYRDVPQIVASVMQIAFFVTPVIFKPTQLGSHDYLLLLNPLASFLEVVRDPLLGSPPSIEALGICAGFLVVGLLGTFYFIGRYSTRIVYWL